ncbi:MAG: D-alanine--D-alanine ligase family protein [Thermomicrobiaceae bacterium]
MAARRIRVGVIFGGRSGEHDVSITSAHAILSHIDRTRFEPVPIGITREGDWVTGGDPLRQLARTSRLPLPDFQGSDEPEPSESPVTDIAETAGSRGVSDRTGTASVQDLDVVFPVLHGPMGEDGTVQGMLELSGIPYIGSAVLGSAASMDKITAKRLCEQIGLPVVPWISFSRRDWQRSPDDVTAKLEDSLGYPCFIKPSNMGSSVGVYKVHGPDELADAINGASTHDRRLLAEQAVDARELEVSVLGNDDPISSIVGEVVPGHEFYDYDAKYVDDSSELFIPAPVSPEVSDEVRRIAVDVFKLLDCAGLARVDCFLERETEKIYLNEVNTIPGFTPISMYPKLWDATGIPFDELISRLIELAIERHSDKYSG